MVDRVAVDRWVAEYFRCWLEKDANGLAELFAEDALYAVNPFRDPIAGRGAIRDYWNRATARQGVLRVMSAPPLCDGDRAAVEWWASWVTDGMPTTLRGCLLVRLTWDGKCEELCEYWHSEKATVPAPRGWDRAN